MPFRIQQDFNNPTSGTRMHERIVTEYEYEMTGTLEVIEEIRNYDSGFCVQSFILMSDSMRPTPVKFDLLRDDVALIGNFSIGQAVRVIFKIEGRIWNDKHYVNLRAMTIEKDERHASEPANEKQEAPEAAGDTSNDAEDEIKF